MRLAGALIAACLLVLNAAPAPHAKTETVLAAYVLLGPSEATPAKAYARVIVPGKAPHCPQLLGADAPLTMSFRDNPHGFKVKVCEAVIPFGTVLTVSWTGQQLPAATSRLSRILLIGDTGCDAKTCLPKDAAQPFGEMARAASRLTPRPDLVIHVGDYNYRGTPSHVDFAGKKQRVYDAGDGSRSPNCQLDEHYVSQNAAKGGPRDSWKMWRLDFFEPAKDLLAAAPFLYARGNHELCSRAAPGWFYFLDASTKLDGGVQLSCSSQASEDQLLFTQPRRIDLESLRLIVLDTANACDDFAPAILVRLYTGQLRSALAGATDGKPLWIVSHRPVWGARRPCPEDGCRGGSQTETVSRTLQAALAQTSGESGASSVDLFVSGHMHLFQSLAFEAVDAAPQLIVGNGGVTTYTEFRNGPFSTSIDGVTASPLSICSMEEAAGAAGCSIQPGARRSPFAASPWSTGGAFAFCRTEQNGRRYLPMQNSEKI